MPSLPPDPTGRPSTAKRAPEDVAFPTGESSSNAPHPEVESKASTNSHHPAASVPVVSAGLNTANESPAPSPAVSSDILSLLNNPGFATGAAALENTDDSPTVITRGIGDRPPPPAPLHVLADNPPQLAGRRLGNYELIESIGAGGMATVLKARDLELGRIVALKILPPTAARDAESVTRFKQEARAAALLDHENIARVYACGEDQGLHFIAFEFVEGINLRQMIERRQTIPPIEAVRYMIQVAAGLAHAAERGVVHRDIKPSNILITPDGRAKIVDMGLARQLEAGANGGVTQSGVTLGTFDYISPEQALDPRRTDVRSDIYSLGCTFYHALTGQPPVPEGTAAKKLYAHQHIDPLDPREIKPEIPDELVVVLARMMAKDPEYRYQSPEELIAHLKGLAERLHLSPEVMGHDSVVRSVRAMRPVQPPQLRLGWALGIAAAVAAIAVFAFSGNEPGPSARLPSWANDANNAKSDSFPPIGNGEKPAPGVPAEDGLIHNAQLLASKITAAKPGMELKIGLAPGTYDLTQLAEPVVFRGKKLELEGSVSRPVTLKVNAAPANPTAMPAGSFSANGSEKVSVSGVRFVCEKTDEDEMPEGPGAAFAAVDVDEVILNDCVFTSPGATGAGAVRLTRTGCVFRAERCVFAPEAFALWLPDTCKATVFDCGFGSLETAIRVGDTRAMPSPIEASVQDVDITLERSSFLIDSGCAVIANAGSGDGAGVRVSARYCVFAADAAINTLDTLPPGATFLRGAAIVRAHSSSAEVQYTGSQKNAYYAVAALLLPSDSGETALSFAQCQERQIRVTDATAAKLPQSPWAELNPRQVLAGADPWRAFGLKVLDRPGAPAIAALFTEDDQVIVLGARFYNPLGAAGASPWRAYPGVRGSFPSGPRSPSAPQTTQLVWFPNPEPKDLPLPSNTHVDLETLLKAARPGDEVLIRHNGVLNVGRNTIELEKLRPASNGDAGLIFKPAEGYAPILASSGTNKLDQTLFRLTNGKVKFQDLQFLLKPNHPRYGQTVAAVAVVGGESCVFENCVFTLAEEDDSKAAVVLVSDPSQMFAMDGGAHPTPKVKFTRCVIRGKGRGIWLKPSRAVDVDAAETLTAIDGPLFLAEAGKMQSGASSSLNLKRLTAFAGGPIVEMRGSRPAVGEMHASGLVQLRVHADECLFAGVPFAGRPLVEIDGVDPEEATRLLSWQVQNANRYANFEDAATVMLVRPSTEGMMTRDWNWNQWITFAAEPAAGVGKRLGKVDFDNPPAGLASLGTFKPGDAAVKSMVFPDLEGKKPIDVGAAIERIPTPAKFE